jgi:hypothetical protein
VIRLTVTDDARLQVHGAMGERDPLPSEIELVREALDPKPLPWWMDYGAVVLGFLALVVLGRGGGL